MKLAERITRELSARAFWGALELAEAVAFAAARELGLSRAMVAEAFAAKAEELGHVCERCRETACKVCNGPETFEQAWSPFEASGYQYGAEALEQVRFGWEIARGKRPHT